MESTVLTLKPRDQFGTRAAESLRKQGGMPANIVGAGQPSLAVSLDKREFDAAIRKGFRAFELDLNGEKTAAILQEVQWDSMGDFIQHVEFIRDPDGSLDVARLAAIAVAKAEQEAAEAAEVAKAAEFAEVAEVAEAAAEEAEDEE
jgi:ribosomal protein L25 (general stress protein Ctc)